VTWRRPQLVLLGLGAFVLAGSVAGAASGAAAINPSRISLNCGEKVVVVRATIDCVATVTDTGPATSRSVPTGAVSFATDARGTFSPASCNLEPAGAFSARCTSRYSPSAIGDGSHAVTASYTGDELHAQSRTSVELDVTPTNDELARTQRLTVPGRTNGTTAGATAGDDPDFCEEVDGTVWYQLGRLRSGRVAVQLVARGRLDAAVGVFRRVRSRFVRLACAPTNDHGIATVSVPATGGELVLGVAQLYDSQSGTFSLSTTLIPSVHAPGKPLARPGARSSLHPLRRPEEAWAVRLSRGTTYKISIAPMGPRCVEASLFRPGTRSFDRAEPILRFRCGGYSLFTPGLDGGGTYSILVSLGSASASVQYRLVVARAGPDDTAPGVPLANGTTARGVAAPAAGDAVDLYRFDVPERSDVTVGLRGTAGARITLALLTDDGRRVACACRPAAGARQRMTLGKGTYYAVVQAHGARAERYELALLIRRITALNLSVATSDGAVTHGSTVGVVANVTPGASGGFVRFQLDRFDPVAGWQFVRVYAVPVSGNAARLEWTPSSVGRFRIRATFSGTREESPSSTGYVLVRVT
jgi:hypothetical protein